MSEITLESTKEKDVLCGQVFCTKDLIYYINCNFCAESFFEVKFLSIHLKSHPISMKDFHSAQPSAQPQLSNIKTEAYCDSENKEEEDNSYTFVDIYNLKIDSDDHDLGTKNQELSDSEDWKCKICTKIFNREVRASHLAKHCIEDSQNLRSKLTPKPFNRSKLHRRKYIIEDWYCKFCNDNLKLTTNQKKLHMQTHRDYSYKCEFKTCRDYFASQSELDVHRSQMHSDDSKLPFKCPICLKLFGLKAKLKVHHKRVHLNERKHKCSYCDKHFFENTERKIHEIRSHTKETFCVCEICGESFITAQALRSHRKRKHVKK